VALLHNTTQVSGFTCKVLKTRLKIVWDMYRIMFTISFVYLLFHLCVSCTVFVLICAVVVLYCLVMCVCVCVCVCACVGFVFCGYFGNMYWIFLGLFKHAVLIKILFC
jgi:hypothetical protein